MTSRTFSSLLIASLLFAACSSDTGNPSASACESISCGSHGECVEAAAGTRCVCQSGYVGDRCEACGSGFQDVDGDGACLATCGTANLACPAHARCDDSSGVASCKCVAGHGGTDCSACLAGYQDNDGDGVCQPCGAEFVEEEITLTATDGVTLPGTLTRPACEGAMPAIVLVHGSGPNSRDELSTGTLLHLHEDTEVALFRELAQVFGAAGIATLRYDKRTCIAANSNGACSRTAYGYDVNTTTLEHFEADVVTAVRFLRERPGIDPARIALLGHSQGTNLVPRVALDDSDIAAVVLIGPATATDPVASFHNQKRFELKYLRSLQPSAEIQAVIDNLEATIATEEPLLQGIWEGTYHGPMSGSPAAFWRSWLSYEADMQNVVPVLTQPLLAVTGELDFNLPPTPELDRIRDWRASKEGDLIFTVPRANHALVLADEDTMVMSVSKPAIDLITAWLRARLELGGEPSTLEVDPSEIDLLSDALLCRLHGAACDTVLIQRYLSTGLDAGQILDRIDTQASGRGALTAADTMRIMAIEEGGERWLIQDNRLAFEDSSSFILRLSFVGGPRLGGYFFR